MLGSIGKSLRRNKRKDSSNQWTKLKNSTCKTLQNFTQITVFKDFCKDSNAESVEKRLSKDVPSANQFGTVQGNVKLVIGLNTKLNVMQEPNK